MIKIKELRKLVNKQGFKLSATALSSVNVLVTTIVKEACKIAKSNGSPKLEQKHFDNIAINSKFKGGSK